MEKFITLLRRDKVIGLPTETVYGLAGNALSDKATLKIYQLKNRPAVNPLIIHVASLDQAMKYGIFDEHAKKLAQHFWQPSVYASSLTLVVPLNKNAGLSKYVTAGLDTVAIRIPNHKIALELLKQCDFPIAAPSANLSTQLSPTKSSHIPFNIPILEGGDCQIGIESTIIEGLTILRPGIVTKKMLEDVLGCEIFLNKNETTIKAPGMLKKHYSPKTKVVLDSLQCGHNEALLGFGSIPCTLNLSPSGDLKEALRHLFSYLYELDQDQYTQINIAPFPKNEELSLSLYDKLNRMVG